MIRPPIHHPHETIREAMRAQAADPRPLIEWNEADRFIDWVRLWGGYCLVAGLGFVVMSFIWVVTP